MKSVQLLTHKNKNLRDFGKLLQQEEVEIIEISEKKYDYFAQIKSKPTFLLKHPRTWIRQIGSFLVKEKLNFEITSFWSKLPFRDYIEYVDLEKKETVKIRENHNPIDLWEITISNLKESIIFEFDEIDDIIQFLSKHYQLHFNET